MDMCLNVIDSIFFDFDKAETSMILLVNGGEYGEISTGSGDDFEEYQEFQLKNEKVLSARVFTTESGTLKGLVIHPVRRYYELNSEGDRKKILPKELNIATMMIQENGKIFVGSFIEVLDQWIDDQGLRIEYERYIDDIEE